MSSRPDPLKKLMKLRPEGLGIPLSLLNILNEQDHVVALVGPASLDASLRELLLSRFVQLGADKQADLFEDGRNGPLNSLSSKNRMAYAMGLYGPGVYSDIDLIRRVRNLFAHSPSNIKFDQPEIYFECQKLRTPRNKMRAEEREIILEPKPLFAVSCAMLSVHLHNAIAAQPSPGLEKIKEAWGDLF